MQKIWKYVLTIARQQAISVPSGAEILCVQTHRGLPCLWVRIPDTKSAQIRREIEMFGGTGHEMDDADRSYIGTYQVHGGDLVFHVYERHSAT